jgi:hypothetical protein
MAPSVYMVGGAKGGVGKSLVSMALLDYFLSRNESVMLVETDTNNPDVAKCYGTEVKTVPINLDERNGWIKLSDTCESAADSTIVINTAARNSEGVKKYGENLNIALEELKRKLIVLWIINRHKDSLELLKLFQQAIPNAHIYVLRNMHFGEEDRFEFYNNSKFRGTIEKNGGKSLNFPDVADRVADEFYTNRMSISKGLKEFPLGNRVELVRWQRECKKVFDEIAHE